MSTEKIFEPTVQIQRFKNTVPPQIQLGVFEIRHSGIADFTGALKEYHREQKDDAAAGMNMPAAKSLSRAKRREQIEQLRQKAVISYEERKGSAAQQFGDPYCTYYNGSPVKPYVDESVVVLHENYNKYVEPYVPVVQAQATAVYAVVLDKLAALKARLDNDALANVKKIVIPDENNIDAFIGTPNPDQEKTVDPVTPEEDLVEPTPLPAASETNVVPNTEGAEETTTDGSEPTEEVEPIPAKTDRTASAEPSSNGKLEKLVEEAESVVGQIAAEEVIEAAQAAGQAL
ncbi:hypothetical protein PMKS-003025 [Pichia membranifaciens]|uniref:Uncharacterized protein n=1 Tax=Pichia membranifaciens TaxID=4926 RepID=A0A1Q2YJ04_9ASCO|nr:hypothetical protein PMKS-003025 [Pichia membranifaciens]